ncbi:apolipoprotein N-acyltransferase [Devosia neptuniae]|jgi:apolipoprotein N-acyltransferase|uniref:apolipoprotein N-acyltransferase n=1 Tax=Devosia TaxID=46913 RepID=UPI0022B00785|nr:apolipoprotein N-acyltransferase [Devosia neptuniae]MCZ4347733.1 apolipoprotein N-acyltransferase [Devosia neptuniae]|tara:strand:- start:6553 stop:8163 length:1611 start_codon:yes stop_codon:yes gene_type:complete
MTWLAETAMLSHGWRRFLLLLIAGALAGLSVPPLFVLPALFIAFPIWIWSLDGAETTRGWRRLFGPAFSIGFAFGWGYFIVAFHWLGAAFFVDGGVMLAIMPFAILALAAMIAVFWGLASAAAHLLWSHGPWRVVTLATFLTIAEWARGHVLTGFPFDLLGYALTPNDEMMQITSVIGIYGLTLVAALIAMTPALIWPADERSLSRRLLPFFIAVAVIAGQLGYGHNRLANTVVTERTDTAMRLVQPLVYEHADWSNADPVALIDRLLMLSDMRMDPTDQGLADIDLLVWPESSLPFFLSTYPEALARIARLLPEGATLLAGAPRQQYEPGSTLASGPPFNAILAIDTNGEVIASYDKSHLVPFGEFLPFGPFFAQLGIKQFVPGAEGWSHGDARRRLMSLPNTPSLLALICYEILFSGDLGDAANAQFLFNITNDAWFDASIGPAQHAHHARVRAVEEGMSLIRAANSGLTFATDPLGRVTAQLAPLQMAALDVSPYERLPATPFAQLRYWPLLVALLLGLGLSVLVHRRRKQPL